MFLPQIDSTVLTEIGESLVNPWSITTIKDLLGKMKATMSKYEVRQLSNHLLVSITLNTKCYSLMLFVPFFQGYHPNTKAYSGKLALSSWQKSARNKVIDIGISFYSLWIASGLCFVLQSFDCLQQFLGIEDYLPF